MGITREDMVEAIREALEPAGWARAMWLAGSDAFGRADALSDVDVQVLVDDGSDDEAFAAAEQALERLAPIDVRLHVPEPTWHGHRQRFYRLAGVHEAWFVDLCVLQASHPERFSEVERHGQRIVLFDRHGELAPTHVDPAATERVVAARAADLLAKQPLLQVLVRKELERDDLVAAADAYIRFTLTPLVAAMRMVHDPARHDFGFRYTRWDLPPDEHQALERLVVWADADALRRNHTEAAQLLEARLRQVLARAAEADGATRPR